MRLLGVLAALGLAALCGASAAPNEGPIRCVIDRREPLGDCIRNAAQAPPIEVLAAAHRSVFRALIWTHEQLPTALITFSRDASGAARLRVQSLIPHASAVYDVALPEAEWSALAARWAAQRGAILAVDHGPVGCITVGAADFEIVEDGRITRTSIGGCQTVFAFVNDFVAQAMHDIPQCATLKLPKPGYELAVLKDCLARTVTPAP